MMADEPRREPRSSISLLQPPKAKRAIVDEAPLASAEHSTARQQSLAQRDALTRYFNAARALYVQGPVDHVWLSLENPYGFASFNTSDVLRQLVSPLRPGHVLDDWTPSDIYLFEVGMRQFGKQFHLIQQLIPTKDTRQVIAFYYLWKKSGLAKTVWMKTAPAKDPFGMKLMKLERQKHGIVPTAYDLLSDGDDDTVLAVKRQSLQQATKKRRIETAVAPPIVVAKSVEHMQDVRAVVTEYFDAVRSLYTPAPIDTRALEASLKQWGLDGTTLLRPTIALLSSLRPVHVLDAWTPKELSIFEIGLELYGKHFHFVAQLLPRKSTSDCIALYYIWKAANPQYATLKRKRPQP
ncbi:hypothetical protein SDRG_04185 [Saprolegnia diclina VS20]|uniref:SANT domain-containing protein n=1 Tax=Saprolegnia diclina (strain VS20) TaxID=1156394 RepID=T0S764_SAPDV|nr:hypothetical protein SDRG_04185 [Saprolegnia diclina VS20]EQC38477.1 hypothetical protein SDRG_04185 [Saprolegnia diclina VS20]|eukprot:XP_008608069.1 hypothetical protein SDRG_04185 [Saprolegnia diclina VS20]